MFGFFKKPAGDNSKLNLAEVTSREKAEALHKAGLLDKLFMRPLEPGGEDHPLNTLYVPPGIVHRKRGIDLEVIQPLAEEGRISQYSAKAEYQDGSVIPISLKITASEPEAFEFVINIWGDALSREEKRWDEVYASREALYAKHFGVITGDVQKLMNLTGIWPGGCIVQIESPPQQLWVTSSFGLTNPDMPATTKSEEYKVETDAQGRAAKYEMRVVGRPPRAIPAGRAGYGYELLLLTTKKEQWPLMFLNWALQAEILRDADIPRRVHDRGALTIEGIGLGNGKSADFLIAPLHRFGPETAILPNGSMELLAATMITRKQMDFALSQGQTALLEQIQSRPQGQVSA